MLLCCMSIPRSYTGIRYLRGCTRQQEQFARGMLAGIVSTVRMENFVMLPHREEYQLSQVLLRELQTRICC